MSIKQLDKAETSSTSDLVLSMEDLEDLVVFFMHMRINEGLSKEIFINMMCKVNKVPDGDERVRTDVEAWIKNTEEKLKRHENTQAP